MYFIEAEHFRNICSRNKGNNFFAGRSKIASRLEECQSRVIRHFDFDSGHNFANAIIAKNKNIA